MLSGKESYSGRDQQLELDIAAYAQFNAVAKEAWIRLPLSKEQIVELSSIRQGPDELAQNFVSRLTQASNRLIGDTEAGQLIIKQILRTLMLYVRQR